MAADAVARLVDDLRSYAASPDAERFDALAVEVLAHQIGTIPAYGRLAAARGFSPAMGWRQAPLVPTELFRDLRLSAADADLQTFRTSGTTAGRRGERHLSSRGLDLYHAGMEAPFVEHVLAGMQGAHWLSLIPPAEELPDSSLSHMVSALARRWAADVAWCLGSQGLDADAFVAAAQASAEPVVVLATSFALVNLLDALAGRPCLLPAGSRMMLTGGFKGKSRTLDEPTLLAEVEATFGLSAAHVVPEYGMTELSSQAYGRPLVANPCLRLRVVDPLTHGDLVAGAVGLVACFDVLNIDNVSAILTSDLGQLDDEGRLTLLGRAPDAVLRGCSLTAEELTARS